MTTTTYSLSHVGRSQRPAFTLDNGRTVRLFPCVLDLTDAEAKRARAKGLTLTASKSRIAPSEAPGPPRVPPPLAPPAAPGAEPDPKPTKVKNPKKG